MKYLFIFLGLTLLSCNQSKTVSNLKDFKLRSINSITAKKHIASSKVTFLEVGSERCYSCKIMGKNIETVKKEHPNFNVIFVDALKDPTGLKTFKVKAIPTQIILDKSGEELYRHLGILTPEQILEIIKKYNATKEI